MIKKILKFILPKKIIVFLKKIQTDLEIRKYKKKSNYQIFKEIYEKKIWSPDAIKNKYKFYSGIGSHHEEFTLEYIEKVSKFLKNFNTKPSVVDLGCGDFFIGSKLRQFCSKYTAIDIYDDLINLNKSTYKDYNVDFIALDITRNSLPSADICFIRQVLQHFSNSSIRKLLNSINGKYKYLILTEHLPQGNFIPNKDISTGPFIRIHKNSGVVLTAEPFNVKVIEEKNICNINPKNIKGFEGFLNTKILHLYK